MSTNREYSLTAHLKRVKRQYQQQSLILRLEELAADLRDFLLEKAVAEAVLDYDAVTHDKLRDRISWLRSAAEAGDLGVVAEHIEVAEEALEAAESRMQGNRAEPLSTYISRLDSMERLNEQLGVVDQATLRELRTLAEEGRWTDDLDIDEDTPIEEAVDAAVEFGEARREEYDVAEQAIFKPYLEGELAEIVEALLSDSPTVLSGIDPTTLDELAESDLGDYVGLRFS
ncbi:hypothetical protein [Haloarchaeobius sp. DFWS5]|uniref:hypothetical protein n=1 Tax=Haloarchaeobius sp. DFWS5 TaxID=3446114 RepID=UPI003EBE15B8